MNPESRARRFWGKVDRTGDCWIWTASIDRDGYGRSGPRLAHRIAYELLVGPIPEGSELHHVCRVRCCVNPGHMEALVRAEHRRAETGLLTHCKNGHEYTPDNTYTYTKSRRCRKCRKCAAEWSRAAYHASKGRAA